MDALAALVYQKCYSGMDALMAAVGGIYGNGLCHPLPHSPSVSISHHCVSHDSNTKHTVYKRLVTQSTQIINQSSDRLCFVFSPTKVLHCQP